MSIKLDSIVGLICLELAWYKNVKKIINFCHFGVLCHGNWQSRWKSVFVVFCHDYVLAGETKVKCGDRV